MCHLQHCRLSNLCVSHWRKCLPWMRLHRTSMFFYMCDSWLFIFALLLHSTRRYHKMVYNGYMITVDLILHMFTIFVWIWNIKLKLSMITWIRVKGCTIVVYSIVSKCVLWCVCIKNQTVLLQLHYRHLTAERDKLFSVVFC